MAKVAKRAKKGAVKSPNKPGAKSEKVKLAIIGGSGLYSMPGLTDTREVRVKTPFGDPSDAIVIGTLEGSAWHFSRATAAATYFHRAKSITAPMSAR